jgi:hypothetical protein
MFARRLVLREFQSCDRSDNGLSLNPYCDAVGWLTVRSTRLGDSPPTLRRLLLFRYPHRLSEQCLHMTTSRLLRSAQLPDEK